MKNTIATILALLILLPLASAAINVGTGNPPSEAERATSVQVFSFGDNAMICVNCPALTTEPEPGMMQATNAESFPRIVCKGDTPCVIYTGLKFKEMYIANPSSENQPYTIVTKNDYQKGKPLTKGTLNFPIEDGQTVVNAEGAKVYTVENPHKIILKNAKAYIDNTPAEDAKVIGNLLKIRGLDKRAPNQLIGDMSIPLKKGDTITFKGLFGDEQYSLEQPVLNVGRFTDNEDDSTAEDENAEDWIEELDNKFLDSDKDRSELKICGKKFVNYYAGSSFELKANEGRCEIPKYQLNTELFEEDDADTVDNKLFAYVCGDIVFEAVGGNAKNIYCNQEDIHNAQLSCGKEGTDPVCTGLNGKTKIKIRLEPGAFLLNNKAGAGIPGDNFRSLKEISSDEQKTYTFVTNEMQILTYPQTINPGRYDKVNNIEGKPIAVTYKDTAALDTNTITLPEDAVVERKRGLQRFFYTLREANYKGILGERIHQINLIYPEGLERNEETSTKITEARTRGATRDDIALLGAVADETIFVQQPNDHIYTVTPLQPGQEESAVEAVTSTPSVAVGEETTLGDYAYRHCFRTDPPAVFRGAAREATEEIAQAMLETNPQLTADTQDILNTPIPAGTSLSLPGTTTEYRLNPRQEQASALESAGVRVTSIVRVRLNTAGCLGLASPAIRGEQCMEKPGAVVKCVPKELSAQCTQVYQPGEAVKECTGTNVCCEVRLAQSGDYCVLPQQNAAISSGAKCKVSIGCRTEVSNAEYGSVSVSRVMHCAEGLSCCKSARGSSRASRQGAASTAVPGDDSECTSTGGVCIDTVTQDCIDSEGNPLVFERNNNCLSKGTDWKCCHGTPVGEARPAGKACTAVGGECRVNCGTGERRGTEEQNKECEGTSAIIGFASIATSTCCVPVRAASGTPVGNARQVEAPVVEEEATGCGPQKAWACKESCNPDGTETHSAGYDGDCSTGKICCRANTL